MIFRPEQRAYDHHHLVDQAMPPRPSIEERLACLREIRSGGDLTQLREAAARHLPDRCNLIVAEAAKIVREFELSGMEPDLLRAWTRLIDGPDPMKADKGCWAKTALIEALAALNYDDPELYQAALTYQQIEPAWPDAIDTAENVRASAAFALARSVRMRTADKLIAFVDYLQGSTFDQVNAVRAMSDTGSESALPLLRMKLRSHGIHSDVAGACMTGLLEMAPTTSIPLVAGFLKSEREELVTEAAAALGSCGKPEAIKSLILAWNRTRDDGLRRSLVLSIGLSRDPSAVDFLIQQLELHHDPDLILNALKPNLVYEEIRLRVDEAKQRRKRPNR
ncbi:HEAT repeat domain-containing protein [Schlesneria sp. T3-172]|uniref:HEAT repeat domain-containing protein n=1 Tax=Schlesneria sphaerica TaxID=3373610 RepID=UPI0037C5456D